MKFLHKSDKRKCLSPDKRHLNTKYDESESEIDEKELIQTLLNENDKLLTDSKN